MNKCLRFLMPVLVLLTVLVLSSCNQVQNEEIEHMLCRDLILEKFPDFSLEEYRSEVADDGTMETYIVVSMEKRNADKFISELADDWPITPVVTTYKNFYDYVNILPESSFEDVRKNLTSTCESEGVRYIFYDNTSEFMEKYSTQIKEYKSSDSQKDAGVIRHEGAFSGLSDPRTPDYALGFVCAFFDSSERRLYYYKFDPAFNEKYSAYL